VQWRRIIGNLKDIQHHHLDNPFLQEISAVKQSSLRKVKRVQYYQPFEEPGDTEVDLLAAIYIEMD
jgi:hypothetical protein